MSRLTNKTIAVPKGVAVNIHPEFIEVKGAKKTVKLPAHPHIKLLAEDGAIKINIDSADLKLNKNKLLKMQKHLNVLAGTVWANLRNAITGVNEGFKIKLELVGVGYRAAVQGNKLNLSLGYSHPVVYPLPQDVIAETPSQTEIMLSSHDNQILGQVAAEIRSYRPPECYKGKGVKFAGEKIVLKETKKK